MSESTTGHFEGRVINPATGTLQGKWVCSCGNKESGLATTHPGATHTWVCMKCKKHVTAQAAKP